MTMDVRPFGENEQVAARLRQMADALSAQGANPFRIAAYNRAADTVAGYSADLRKLYEKEGAKGLDALPGIGSGIASAIGEILQTGRWSQLERVRGTLEPERLFQTVPGIGPGLARRIHDTLHVDSLEALEVAAHDGRLDSLARIGKRRAAAIRAALTEMLDRTRPRRRSPTPAPAMEPAVAMLLDVDREYREQAKSGKLPTIAPRRFNPEQKSWLPVLHTTRGDWHFTALFSNTAKAHELGKTRDWVVIYFYDTDHNERQRTVVTETRGEIEGKRVVRGREAECRRHYITAALH
jgi:hypothetical protein